MNIFFVTQVNNLAYFVYYVEPFLPHDYHNILSPKYVKYLHLSKNEP